MQADKTDENARPQLDSDGLIGEADNSEQKQPAENGSAQGRCVVKTVPAETKPEPLEKLQEGFNKLILQLQGINEGLNRQFTQQQDFLSRIDKLPELLESFPAAVENQKQLTEQLVDQLRVTTEHSQRFVTTVEKIPAETCRQTEALAGIDQRLTTVADADARMAEGFDKFDETLNKLNQSTTNQTDGIAQMSKTLTAGDRYLKYVISRQNRRFMWMFAICLGVSFLVILILAGIVLYVGK